MAVGAADVLVHAVLLALVFPRYGFGDLFVLELVHGEVFGMAFDDVVAAYVQATGNLQVGRRALVVVVPVVLFLNVGGDVHAADLEGGGHAAAEGVRVDLGRVNLRADQALSAASHCVGGHAFRPVGWVLAHVPVLGGLQGVHRVQFVDGQVTGTTAQGLVSGGVQKSGRAESLGDVFLVVPGVEFGVVLDVNVGVNHQEGGTFSIDHVATSACGVIKA